MNSFNKMSPILEVLISSGNNIDIKKFGVFAYKPVTITQLKSVTKTSFNMDIFNRLLLISYPYLSSIRKKQTFSTTGMIVIHTRLIAPTTIVN